MSKVTPVNTTEMTVNMSTQNVGDDYTEAKADQVTCCRCLKIETGMKCIMFY